jgi:hypothetical protein
MRALFALLGLLVATTAAADAPKRTRQSTTLRAAAPTAAFVFAPAPPSFASGDSATRGGAVTVTRNSTPFCEAAGANVAANTLCVGSSGAEVYGAGGNNLLYSETVYAASATVPQSPWTRSSSLVTFAANNQINVAAVPNGQRGVLSQPVTGTAAAWSLSCAIEGVTSGTVWVSMMNNSSGSYAGRTVCSYAAGEVKTCSVTGTLNGTDPWGMQVGVDRQFDGGNQTFADAQQFKVRRCWAFPGAAHGQYYATTAATVTAPATVVTAANPLVGLGADWYCSGMWTPAAGTWGGATKWLLALGTGAVNASSVYETAANALAFDIWDAGGAKRTVSATAPSAGPHSVTIASTAAGAMALYVDGVSVGTTSGAGTGVLSAHQATMVLGGIDTSAQFNGALRNIRCGKGLKVAP